MDDESFDQLFVPIMDTIMARYQPDAIVLQSGEREGVGGAVSGLAAAAEQGKGLLLYRACCCCCRACCGCYRDCLM